MQRVSCIHKSLQLRRWIVSLHLKGFGLSFSFIIDGFQISFHLSLQSSKFQSSTLNIIIASIGSGLGKILMDRSIISFSFFSFCLCSWGLFFFRFCISSWSVCGSCISFSSRCFSCWCLFCCRLLFFSSS